MPSLPGQWFGLPTHTVDPLYILFVCTISSISCDCCPIFYYILVLLLQNYSLSPVYSASIFRALSKEHDSVIHKLLYSTCTTLQCIRIITCMQHPLRTVCRTAKCVCLVWTMLRYKKGSKCWHVIYVINLSNLSLTCSTYILTCTI